MRHCPHQRPAWEGVFVALSRLISFAFVTSVCVSCGGGGGGEGGGTTTIDIPPIAASSPVLDDGTRVTEKGFEALVSGPVEVAATAEFDPYLIVETSEGGVTRVVADDDGGDDADAKALFDAVAGITYRVLVVSSSADGGEVSLTYDPTELSPVGRKADKADGR